MHAFGRFTYDAKETAAYAADQDAADKEQLGTDVSPKPRRPARHVPDLAAEERAARASPFLPPLGPAGWVEAPITEAMLDEDNEGFVDFHGEKDAPGINNKQRALLAMFETAHCDQASWQLMAAERDALSDRRATMLCSTHERAYRGN
jgi:hypothetical protein